MEMRLLELFYLLKDSHKEPLGDQQRKNMSLIIDHLKSQLNDLEQFAYMVGD